MNMSSTTSSFEDFLAYAEQQFGIQFLAWQKEILKMIYENKQGCYCMMRRRCGMTMLREAAELLEEIKKENGNELYR